MSSQPVEESFLDKYGQFIALLIGVIPAVTLATIMPHLYGAIVEYEVPVWGHSVKMTISEIFMIAFFLVVAKELREAFLKGDPDKGLPDGPLARPKDNVATIAGTLGGVVVPAVAFIVCSNLFVPELADFRSGYWIIAAATDIALAMVIARLLFGRLHPAVAFLSSLAIIDDGIGVSLIALFVNDGAVSLVWMFGAFVYSVGAALVMRKMFSIKRWYWYVIFAGVPATVIFLWLHLPSAISMVGIVFGMPHARYDRGIFVESGKGEDALNRMEDFFKKPMLLILALFGFVSAGVPLAVDAFMSAPALIVLGSLTVGKLVGVVSFTALAMLLLRAPLPRGMRFREAWVIGALAGIGFTVALLVADLVYVGQIQQLVKAGALMSFPIGFAVAIGAWLVLRRVHARKE